MAPRGECSVFSVRCSVFTVHRSLFTVHRSLFTVLALALALDAAAAETIALRRISCRVRILTVAQAAESVTINNPLPWGRIEEIAPDGAWVEAGQTVVWFDPVGPSNNLERLRRTHAIGQAELQARVTDSDNRRLELTDRLQGVRDRLAVEEARRDRLRALPDPAEVTIASGDLRVAELDAAAASNDLQRARPRLAQRLISPAAFEKLQSAYDEASAREASARAVCDVAALPASPLELESVGLAIANLRLDAADLERQIDDTDRITAFQREASAARAALLDRRIAEHAEELESTRLRAPLSGFFSYLREFRRRVLASGDRMWRNFSIATMPRAETLVLKGEFKEELRRFLAPGDPVTIRFVGRMDQPVTGRVDSVGEHARDSGEKTEMSWGGQAETGLKVHDVTIRPDALAPWMSLGMHAECEIVSAQSIEAPAVPADYVVRRDGAALLTVDGRTAAVAGTVVDGWFVLSETNWLGRAVSPPGRAAAPIAAERADAAVTASNILFETSGELVPTRMTDVVTRRIHGWQKIAWLVGEDTSVTTGTFVARLDDKEANEEVNEWEQRLTEARSNREAQEEGLNLRRSQQAFQSRIESNNVRIAELDWRLAEAGVDGRALADARLQARLAAIHLANMTREREAVARRPAELRARQEEVAAARALQRARLQAEAADVRLAELAAGPDPLLVARKRSAYAEQALTFRNRQLTAEADGFRGQADLDRAVRQENYVRRQLEQRRDSRENLSLRAPCDGVVRYNRAWHDGSFVKVASGVMLGSGMIPLRVADVAGMEVRAEMPERFYDRVRPGQPVAVRIASVSDTPFSGTIAGVDDLFEQKRASETDSGLYSSREPTGETVGYLRVAVTPEAGIRLKPGMVARIAVSAPAGRPGGEP